MRAVIIQSNYIPWKGYFELLARADEVILFDSVQSTKNDWRNRNQVKTAAGKTWLTIPIRHSTSLRVREVEVATMNWADKHLRTLTQAYARAPCAAEMLPQIRNWYAEAAQSGRLSDINRVLIRRVLEALGVAPRLREVHDVLDDAEHDRLEPTDRLVTICQRIGADRYLTGPAARGYLNEAAFERAAIALEWFHYDGYPSYPQLHGEFDHAVSILDVLLMTGSQARDYAFRPF